MPIYEYKCAECGAHLEKMQKISDALLTVCEACGGRLEKQWSLSGFQFKGEGWYVTDYAGKKGDGKEAKSENGAKGDAGEKTEKTSVAESTAAPEAASNTKSDNANGSAKETAAKKD
ncbi:MAG TPA: FmdB family zinc ribbon protein [Pyrinomonadaceae bacterium]|jgi:putative FmdB family regulatory protein